MKLTCNSIIIVLLVHFFVLRIDRHKAPSRLSLSVIKPKKINLKIRKNQKTKKHQRNAAGPKRSRPIQEDQISFSKLGKFLRRNQGAVIKSGKVGNLDFSKSSKGVQFSEWIFYRINYNDQLFYCNQKGKVKVRAYFDKHGRFVKNESSIQSSFPMLKEHTIKTLETLVLPYYLSGPLQINLLLEYIRTPAASHSQRFVHKDFYYIQILSNDINKGHVSRLDTRTNCR